VVYTDFSKWVVISVGFTGKNLSLTDVIGSRYTTKAKAANVTVHKDNQFMGPNRITDFEEQNPS
jgi:hypothetical protein